MREETPKRKEGKGNGVGDSNNTDKGKSENEETQSRMCKSNKDALSIPTNNGSCPPIAAKETGCCVVGKGVIMNCLQRPPQTLRQFMYKLNNCNMESSDIKKVRNFLANYDINLVTENTILDSAFWEAFFAEHDTLAEKMLRVKQPCTTDEYIAAIYEQEMTDTIQPFVESIVNLLERGKGVADFMQFVSSFQASVNIRPLFMESGTHPIMWTEEQSLVINGLEGVIPKYCRTDKTVYVCAGLVLRMKLLTVWPPLNGIVFDYQIQDRAMELLLYNIALFPKVTFLVNDVSDIWTLPELVSKGFEKLVHVEEFIVTGSGRNAPNVSKSLHVQLRDLASLLNNLTLQKCNINVTHFKLILAGLKLRERPIQVLHLGENPMIGGDIKHNDVDDITVRVVDSLALNGCNINTHTAAACLKMSEGTLDLSNNSNIQWALLKGEVNVKQLIAKGRKKLHFGANFFKLQKLCSDQEIDVHLVDKMNHLTYFSGEINSRPQQRFDWAVPEALRFTSDETVFATCLKDNGKLTNLILGGHAGNGTFKSKLNDEDSFKLKAILQDKRCQLEVLGLSQCVGLTNIVPFTMYLKHLKELYIADMNIDPGKIGSEAVEKIGIGLAELLRTSNTLKVLVLDNNAFDSQSIGDIAFGLKANQSLARLHMAGVPMYDTTLDFHILNHSLEVLHIGGGARDNRVDFKNVDNFYKVLVESFASFENLRTLNCKNLLQRIDEKPIAALVKCIRVCVKLTTLNLSHCNLDYRHMKHIIDALRGSSVTHLVLNYNKTIGLTVFHSILECLADSDSKIEYIGLLDVFNPANRQKIRKKFTKSFPQLKFIL